MTKEHHPAPSISCPLAYEIYNYFPLFTVMCYMEEIRSRVTAIYDYNYLLLLSLSLREEHHKRVPCLLDSYACHNQQLNGRYNDHLSKQLSWREHYLKNNNQNSNNEKGTQCIEKGTKNFISTR